MNAFLAGALGAIVGLTASLLVSLLWGRGPFRFIDLVRIDSMDYLMTVQIEGYLIQFRRKDGNWYHYLSFGKVEGVDNAYLEELFEEHISPGR